MWKSYKIEISAQWPSRLSSRFNLHAPKGINAASLIVYVPDKRIEAVCWSFRALKR